MEAFKCTREAGQVLVVDLQIGEARDGIGRGFGASEDRDFVFSRADWDTEEVCCDVCEGLIIRWGA